MNVVDRARSQEDTGVEVGGGGEHEAEDAVRVVAADGFSEWEGR